MRLDHPTQLSDIIERDLTETRKQLSENAFSNHKLLEAQASNIEDMPLASLLLISASLGAYHPDELIKVATGLELLRMAVDKHYKSAGDNNTNKNLPLVSADYYYARAISIAVGLGSNFVVESMVKSIADLAEAEVLMHGKTGLEGNDSIASTEKQFSLFRTAVKLGVRLSGCSSDLENALASFAIIYGRTYILVSELERDDGVSLGEHLTCIIEQVEKDLKTLPVAQSQLLKDLLFSLFNQARIPQ